MVSGYTPLVPTLGSITIGTAALVLFTGYALYAWFQRRYGRWGR